MNHYSFLGELTGAPNPGQAILARNHLFPLKSESDYLINAELERSPSLRSYILPPVLYTLVNEIIEQFHGYGFEFDMILIRLGAPILEKVPDGLLAPNVFISVDTDMLLDFSHNRGKKRILSISNNFLIHYVNDFGNNQIALNLYYDEDKSDEFEKIVAGLKTRNIHGEILCP